MAAKKIKAILKLNLSAGAAFALPTKPGACPAPTKTNTPTTLPQTY